MLYLIKGFKIANLFQQVQKRKVKFCEREMLRSRFALKLIIITLLKYLPLILKDFQTLYKITSQN